MTADVVPEPPRPTPPSALASPSPLPIQSGVRSEIQTTRMPSRMQSRSQLRLRLMQVELFERPVTLRLPFRFGAATVTRCPQAFVRVVAEAGGRSVVGATAELMVPKWFDKSPALTHEQNFEQLRQALRIARSAYLEAGAELSPWALCDAQGEAAIAHGVALGLPRLAAQFGAAQLDKAVADAALRSAGMGWCEGVEAGVLGDPWSARLAWQRPAHVALRHTVGLADRLTPSDPRGDEGGSGGVGRNGRAGDSAGIAGGSASADPKDGLPTTLQSAIATYGLRFFKLKLSGDAARDMPRLAAITALLERDAGDYRVTLDGNETFADADALGRWWRALKAEPALAPLLQRSLLLEQPLARARALAEPIAALGIELPVILDESDDHVEALDEGLTLGYRGISSKACKGLYRSLRNAAFIAERPLQGLLLSGEDLTCQAGLAVQQDTLLAASLGVAHIERNGHHYVDGFGVAPPEEALAFAKAHPALYSVQGGRVRLLVRDGRLDLRDLHSIGFASAAEPQWHTLQAIA